MLRFITAVALALTIASAFALYAISYDTRRIALNVQADERQTERLRNEIAVLKAERAYLSRPERIEPLARAIGLEPAAGRQHVRHDALLSANQHQVRQ